jgi:hypothetical protein
MLPYDQQTGCPLVGLLFGRQRRLALSLTFCENQYVRACNAPHSRQLLGRLRSAKCHLTSRLTVPMLVRPISKSIFWLNANHFVGDQPLESCLRRLQYFLLSLAPQAHGGVVA